MVKRRLKAEEVALRAARNAEKVDRDGQQINDRARFDREIRFIKTQEFTVAVAIMTLLSAILGVGHLLKPLYSWQTSLGVIAAAALGIVGIFYMWSLETHLSNTRLQLDPKDRKASTRGAWVISAIESALFAGTVVVAYAFSALPREVPVWICELCY
jgi:hypothetical protein